VDDGQANADRAPILISRRENLNPSLTPAVASSDERDVDGAHRWTSSSASSSPGAADSSA